MDWAARRRHYEGIPLVVAPVTVWAGGPRQIEEVGVVMGAFKRLSSQPAPGPATADIPFLQPVEAGDFISLIIANGNFGPNSYLGVVDGLTDTQGNTYAIDFHVDSADGGSPSLWVASSVLKTALTASDVLTVKWHGGNGGGAALYGSSFRNVTGLDVAGPQTAGQTVSVNAGALDCVIGVGSCIPLVANDTTFPWLEIITEPDGYIPYVSGTTGGDINDGIISSYQTVPTAGSVSYVVPKTVYTPVLGVLAYGTTIAFIPPAVTTVYDATLGINVQQVVATLSGLPRIQQQFLDYGTAAVVTAGIGTDPVAPFAATAGTLYQNEFWLKGSAGGEQIRVELGLIGDDDSFTSDEVSNVLTLGTSWVKYGLTWTPLTSGPGMLRFTAVNAATFSVALA